MENYFSRLYGDPRSFERDFMCGHRLRTLNVIRKDAHLCAIFNRAVRDGYGRNFSLL